MTSKNESQQQRARLSTWRTHTLRAFVALAIVAFGMFALRGKEKPVSPETGPKADATRQRNAKPLNTRVHDSALSNLEPKTSAAMPESVAQEDSESPSSEEWDDNPLGDLIRNIVDEDKNLGTFLYFYEHVLLDAESRKQYEKLLSDEDVYADTAQDLLYPGETKETLQGNMKRMMKIDYLREALVWDENPSRDALLSTIERIILDDNFTDDMATDMRLSIGTNKMELYTLLFEHAPGRAAAVVQQAQNTRLEPLMDFIAESIQRRQQIELSSASELRP